MRPGFSWVGLCYLAMLLIPNALWTKRQPRDYARYVKGENKWLLALERVGEVLVTCVAVLFSDFNLRPWTAWCVFLIASFFCMLLYEVFWVRYFRSARTMRDFYGPLFRIPVPGASLPVLGFLLLGIYGGNSLMIFSGLLLGVGHTGIHLAHAREAGIERKRSPIAVQILKTALIATAAVILAMITAVTAVRNVRQVRHWQNLARGVDEGIYVSLNGQEQYVLLTGRDENNPVIVYLHGGPASPDTSCAYAFADELTADYTFVGWDQRGCGRTYFRNAGSDPENQTATFSQAEEDLDALVDYLRDRFQKDKVILLGHSYGTILGSKYALDHPDKVAAYIAVSQVTSLEETDEYSYQDALRRAMEAGEDTGKLTAAHERFQQEGSLETLMAVRALTKAYHPVRIPEDETWTALFSPYFGVDDFRWFLKQAGGMEGFFALNRQLFTAAFAFDAYQQSTAYQVPVYFISGTDDWICPISSVQAYMEAVAAPDKDLILLDGCGHSPQYALPREFAAAVQNCLERAAENKTKASENFQEKEGNPAYAENIACN